MLENPTTWDSLIVNRRKPITYRVFRYLADATRVSLHKFDPCDRHEAYPHPHPWPGAFTILEGSYRMWIGFTPDLESREPITVTETVLTAGSRYEIVEPRTWHSVTPLEECWTVMVNGTPWREKARRFAHRPRPVKIWTRCRRGSWRHTWRSSGAFLANGRCQPAGETSRSTRCAGLTGRLTPAVRLLLPARQRRWESLHFSRVQRAFISASASLCFSSVAQLRIFQRIVLQVEQLHELRMSVYVTYFQRSVRTPSVRGMWLFGLVLAK